MSANINQTPLTRDINIFFLLERGGKKLSSYAVVCEFNEFRQLQKRVSVRLEKMSRDNLCILHSFFSFSKNKSRLVAQKISSFSFFFNRRHVENVSLNLGKKKKLFFFASHAAFQLYDRCVFVLV